MLMEFERCHIYFEILSIASDHRDSMQQRIYPIAPVWGVRNTTD